MNEEIMHCFKHSCWKIQAAEVVYWAISIFIWVITATSKAAKDKPKLTKCFRKITTDSGAEEEEEYYVDEEGNEYKSDDSDNEEDDDEATKPAAKTNDDEDDDEPDDESDKPNDEWFYLLRIN